MARKLLAGAFALAILAGVAVALRGQDWSQVAPLAGRRSLGWLAAALLANAAGLLLGMAAWRALLVDLGGPVNGWAGARIFFVAFLAKFLPGKVWALPAVIRMGRAVAVPPLRMTAIFLLSWVVTLLTGLTVGAAAGPGVLGAQAWWLVAAAVPVLACAIRPDLVNRAAGAVTRLLRRPPPVRASDRGMRRAIAAQSASWVVSGHHVWLLAIAAGAPPAPAYLICVAGFSLATAGGAAIALIPDGIGVREAVLVVALATVLPLPVAGTVALASRLVCTLSEIAVAGGGLLTAHLVLRHHNKEEEPAWQN